MLTSAVHIIGIIQRRLVWLLPKDNMQIREAFYIFKKDRGNSLAVQWLGLQALTAEGPGSIPGWGSRIPQVGGRG